MNMEIIEWVGVITGILAVVLLYFNNIFTWPIGFINIACFLYLFWHLNLFGDFVVQIMFLLIGVRGWVYWSKTDFKLPSVLKSRQRLYIVLLTLFSYPLFYFFLNEFTNCSYPILESAILTLSIFGQWLTAKRLIENWLYWLMADFLMIIVYSLKGLYPTTAYASIIFVIGVFGWFKWNSMLKLDGKKKDRLDSGLYN